MRVRYNSGTSGGAPLSVTFGEEIGSVKFRIEATFSIDGKTCVAGRTAEDTDFKISSSSRLDGVAILERLEVPPKLRRPVLKNAVFFVLAAPDALQRFHKYDVVELTP